MRAPSRLPGAEPIAWIILVVAGLFEVAMASCLRASRGFGEPLPSVGFAFFAVTSSGLLSLALKNLEVSTAYRRSAAEAPRRTVLIS